jgi:hypothetical protein
MFLFFGVTQMNSEINSCNFDVTWERIKQITGWSDYKDLALFVGSTSQSISGIKKRGKFPIEWAFRIADKYNSSTDWILTGKGESKRESTVYHMGDVIQNEDVSKEYLAGYHDPVTKAFVMDWLSLSDVVKMRVWTLVKEELERAKEK